MFSSWIIYAAQVEHYIILYGYPLLTHNIHILYTSWWNTLMNRIKWNDGAKYIGRCHVYMWCFETIHRKCWCMNCWYLVITRSVLTHYYIQHDSDNGKSLFSLETHNLRTKYWAKIVSALTRKNTVLHRFHTIHEGTEFMRWGNSLIPKFPFGTTTMLGYIWR